METRARYVLIGAFTLLGFLGIMVFLLWFGKAQSDRQFSYYDALFDSVAGISRGSEVRFAGLGVGQVTSLALDRDDSGKVRVRLEVAAATPVRTDSVATIEAQGVTGVATVSIAAGRPDQPLARDVTDGIPVLPTGRSALQSLSEDVPGLIAEASAAIAQVNAVLGPDNREKFAAIMTSAQSAAAQLDSSMGALDQTIADVSGAVGSLKDISGSFGPLADRAGKLLGTADAAVAEFAALKPQAGDLLDRGQQTLESAQTTIDGPLRTALDDIAATSTIARETLTDLKPQTKLLVDTWTIAGNRTSARLSEVRDVIASVKSSVDAFDPDTLTRVNDALSRIAADLPKVTGDLRAAADSARMAFDGLGRVVRQAEAPLSDFVRTALPQFGQLAAEGTRLIKTLDAVATRLQRNPAGAILNSDTPEFRR